MHAVCTCDYCGAEFPDEEAYSRHLAAEHDEELGPIDRRLVAEMEPDGQKAASRPSRRLVAVAVVLAVGLAVAALWPSGSGMATPYDHGEVHYHGTLEVVVDGEQLDLTRSEYVQQDPYVYFIAEDGPIWHAHARGITVEYLAYTLGIDLSADGDEATVDGSTYHNDRAGETVQVTVDGEAVSPRDHELEGVRDPARASDGDRVRIVVGTDVD